MSDSKITLTQADLRRRVYKQMLLRGQRFLKYKHGRSNGRVLWVDSELNRLLWAPESPDLYTPAGQPDSSKARGSIPLSAIVKISLNPKEHKSTCSAFVKKFSKKK